jgi:hypothetical protein
MERYVLVTANGLSVAVSPRRMPIGRGAIWFFTSKPSAVILFANAAIWRQRSGRYSGCCTVIDSGRRTLRTRSVMRSSSVCRKLSSGDRYASEIICSTPWPASVSADASAVNSSTDEKRVPSGAPSLVRWI